MITALTYLLTSMSLALILSLARSSGHKLQQDSEVFRYQKGGIRALFFCIPGFILLCFSVYFAAGPLPSRDMYYPYIFGAVVLLALLIFVYRYLRAYAIVATQDGLLVNGLWQSRFVAYQQIKKVTLVEGGKGGLVLSVFDNHDKRIFALSNSFEDLLGLSSLVRIRAGKFGAIYKRRDKWGKWSA